MTWWKALIFLWTAAGASFVAAVSVAWVRQDREEELAELRDRAVKDAHTIAALRNENRLLEAQLKLACEVFITEVTP